MKILLATDGSKASDDAAWLLARLHFKDPIELTLATVASVPQLAAMRQDVTPGVEAYVSEYREKLAADLEKTAENFAGIDGTVRTQLLEGHAADALLDFAEDQGTELIVVGARGLSGVQRWLLGSVSQTVARYAPCSVLVTRPTQVQEPGDRPFRVAVCHDGSDSSQRAVDTLASMTWGPTVELAVLNVLPVASHYGMEYLQTMEPYWREELIRAEDAVDAAVKQLSGVAKNVKREFRRADWVADDIVEYLTDSQTDLVVLGDRGHSRISRLLLGSTSERVLRHAPCSVWIVRPEKKT